MNIYNRRLYLAVFVIIVMLSMNVSAVYAQTSYHLSAPYQYAKQWWLTELGSADCQVDGTNGKIYVFAHGWVGWAKGQRFLGYYLSVSEPSHISVRVSYKLYFKLIGSGISKVWISIQLYDKDHPLDLRCCDDYGNPNYNPDHTALEKFTDKLFSGSQAENGYSRTTPYYGFSTVLYPNKQYIIIVSFAGYAAFGGKVVGYSGSGYAYAIVYYIDVTVYPAY